MHRSDYTQNIGDEKEIVMLSESEYTGAYTEPPIPGASLKATVGLSAEKPVIGEYYDKNGGNES